MRVILREDIPDLGEAGDVVEVKAGYARNYLIPRKLAMAATEGNLKTYRDIARGREARSEKERGQAGEVAARLAQIELRMSVEVGEEEQLYGSVTSQMIVDALVKQGFSLERRQVILPAPIKALGEFEVPIHLHRGIEPTVRIVVEKRVESTT